ncbi:hypothetical protein KKA72_02205 [Patescibacteria group bacterium]|nr:hypothetical protein [Patescibacteria group bacterium]MBU1877135.1 hypothetical protein [Patescibacteria group bacterium]
MKKTWIKIEGIQIHSLRKIYPFKSEKKDNENRISASVRIGDAFDINGVNIGIKKNDNQFFQNWSEADARLLDVPALHRKLKKGNSLLHDVLARAIFLFCTGEGNESIRKFIIENAEQPALPFFKPEEWKGLSLRIPVEFIKSRHFFYLWTNKVFVDIQIGHHLIFWNVRIYDGKKINLSNDRILDPTLRNIIENILKKKEVKGTILDVLKKERDDITNKFIDVTKACDIEKIPLIRFY